MVRFENRGVVGVHGAVPEAGSGVGNTNEGSGAAGNRFLGKIFFVTFIRSVFFFNHDFVRHSQCGGPS